MTAAVSIVVVSWNTHAALARCLASVVRDPLGAEAEVWVVDNGSSDGSAAMVEERFPSIRLVRNDANRGFAAACNQALKRARGRVVVLLNSDAMVEPGALAAMVGALHRRPDVGVVGARLLSPDGRPQRCYGPVPSVRSFVAEMLGLGAVPGLRRLLPEVCSPPQRRELPREVGHVSGACLAIRRDVLERAGLLDERFFLYFEDTDLCVRARRAGFLVWFEPGALVRHEGQASASQLGPGAEARYAEAAHAFVRKHHGERAARRLGSVFRWWLAAQVWVHRVEVLARRPGARETLARKQRLRRLHGSLSLGPGGWSCPCGATTVRPVRIGTETGLRCKRCHLLAMPTPGQLAAWYGREYWHHDAGVQLAEGRAGVQAHALRSVESLLPGPGTLVDVGCGAGILLALARERGWREIGFDPSAQAMTHARSRGLEVRASPWPPAALEDGTADAVTFVNSLDHLRDPVAALAEARRVLRPGGVLYVRVPNAPVHVGLLAVLATLGLGRLPVFHLYGFGRRALRHHLARLGFRVLALRTAPPSSEGPGGELRPVRLAVRCLHRLLAAPGLDRLTIGPSIEALAVKTPSTDGSAGTTPPGRQGTVVAGAAGKTGRGRQSA